MAVLAVNRSRATDASFCTSAGESEEVRKRRAVKSDVRSGVVRSPQLKVLRFSVIVAHGSQNTVSRSGE